GDRAAVLLLQARELWAVHALPRRYRLDVARYGAAGARRGAEARNRHAARRVEAGRGPHDLRAGRCRGLADPGPDPALPPRDRATHRRVHPQCASGRAGACGGGVGRAMVKSTASTLERDMARAINLMAHPTAAFAAASAIGLGLASQAMGLWFGTVAGVMEVALRATVDAAQALPDSARPAA